MKGEGFFCAKPMCNGNIICSQFTRFHQFIDGCYFVHCPPIQLYGDMLFFGEIGGLETYHISSCRFGISDTVMAENDGSPGCLIDVFDININFCQ